MNADQAKRLGVDIYTEPGLDALRRMVKDDPEWAVSRLAAERAENLALAARVEERLPRLVVPEWSETVGEKGLNPMEQFVYDNEPAGIEDADAFRSGLQALLDWATGFAARTQTEEGAS